MQDKAGQIRKGEELDNSILKNCLIENIPNLEGDLEIKQFAGGMSNLTYLLKMGEYEMVLRRPPVGAKVKGGHDMGREYKVLTALLPHYSKIPKTLLFCEDTVILGAPFYVMERVKGVILRAKMPAEMWPNPLIMSGIAKSLIDTFVDLHAVDYKAAGLENLGRPEGYVRRQIEGWAGRYLKAKTEHLPAIEKTAKWLLENMPSHSENALIHNDFKYDNLVLETEDWTNVLAILDWEMATLGDPLMDLGSSLGYWINADDPDFLKALALSPTTLPGNPSREELVQMYALKSGRDVSNITFYFVYGIFKLAVVAQQIYFRYQKGHSQDHRFARMIEGVKGCGALAERVIEKQRLDGLW